MATDPLSRVFSALADPTRRDLVARLAVGDASVNELAEPYDVSLQAVSKHLKVLEDAGLISRGRDGQLRPSRLRGEPLKEAVTWLESYRNFWERGFDRMDTRLRVGNAHRG